MIVTGSQKKIKKIKNPFSQTTVFFLAHNIHLYTHIFICTHTSFFPPIGLKILLPLYLWKSAKSGSFSNLLVVRKLKMKVQIRSPTAPKAEPILDIGFKSSYLLY